MKHPIGLGAAFYPEHQLPEHRKTCYDLLEKSGLRYVRFGEFAWDMLEPEEGKYDFSFYDEVISELEKRHIGVILGTPTPTPPVWACKKYDLNPVKADGKTLKFGSRRYVCPNSEDYLTLGRKLTAAMGAHYANCKNVIAWQIDNEIGHPFCKCPNCLKKFQDFCRKTFGTIEAYNLKVCASFWGQTLKSFDEIGFPEDFLNPAITRLYHQFYSESVIQCYGGMADVLRENGVTAPITTNYMVPWYGYDHEELAKKLDFCGGDYYFGNHPFGNDVVATLFSAAYLKSFKKNVHPGFLEFRGSCDSSTDPLPGEIAFHTVAAIAGGADFISYFRFDTCPGGAERDYGIVRRVNCPGRFYTEISDLTKSISDLTPLLEKSGESEISQTAILFSYDSQYDYSENPPEHDLFASSGCTYATNISYVYRGLLNAGETPDVILPGADFSAYKLVIAPGLEILPNDLAEKIRAFVNNGGIFLMLPHSGIYDNDLKVFSDGCPGPLCDVFGVQISNYGRTTPDKISVVSDDYPACGIHWMEELIPAKGTTVTAWFENARRKFKVPAASEAIYGKGRACYWGTFPRDTEVQAQWFKTFFKRMNMTLPNAELPKGIYRFRRIFGDKTVVFTIDAIKETATYAIE